MVEHATAAAPESPAAARTRVRAVLPWAALWLAVAVGALLRCVGLDRLSFWFDEAWTVWYSRQPVDALLGASYEQSFHPPLYYLLLHYWLLAGDSETWTRLLSALFGVAAIPVLYALGRILWGPRAGLAAAWLLALSPWHVWYSQEVRMYSLIVLLAALSLLAGAGWLRTPNWGWALLYLGSTLVGLYTNYTMFAIWPLEALALLPLAGPAGRPAPWRAWIALQLLVVVGYLPQLLHLPAVVNGLLASTFLGVQVGSLGRYLGPALAALALLALLAVVAWHWLRRRPPATVRRLAAWAFVLIWLGAAAMMVIPGATLPKRQLSVLIPAVCLGAAWALAHPPRPAIALRNLALAGALAVLAMIAVVPKEPWREALADMHRQTAPGDFVVIEPEWMTVPFDYYDRGRLARQWIDPTFLTPAFAAQLQPYRRVWLVLSSAEKVDPRGQAPQWFAAHYPLLSERQYYHLTVQLYAVQNRP